MKTLREEIEEKFNEYEVDKEALLYFARKCFIEEKFGIKIEIVPFVNECFTDYKVHFNNEFLQLPRIAFGSYNTALKYAVEYFYDNVQKTENVLKLI